MEDVLSLFFVVVCFSFCKKKKKKKEEKWKGKRELTYFICKFGSLYFFLTAKTKTKKKKINFTYLSSINNPDNYIKYIYICIYIYI